jgi:hypothetical protein
MEKVVPRAWEWFLHEEKVVSRGWSLFLHAKKGMIQAQRGVNEKLYCLLSGLLGLISFIVTVLNILHTLMFIKVKCFYT